MSGEFEDKVVWITGASSGIGRETALEFARKGADLALSARRREQLEKVAGAVREEGGAALVVPCDVTESEQIESAVTQIVERFGRLDVAMANAGFSVTGPIREVGEDEWRRQFDVNVIGVAMTARAAIPELEKTDGRLALIGSVAGLVPVPGNGAYGASKSAVDTIGKVLSIELAGTGVSCTTIHPGFVESDIAKVDNEGKHHDDWKDPRPEMLMWSTDKAARVIVKAIRKRKREYVFTAHGKLAAFLGRHASGMTSFVMSKLGDLRS